MSPAVQHMKCGGATGADVALDGTDGGGVRGNDEAGALGGIGAIGGRPGGALDGTNGGGIRGND